MSLDVGQLISRVRSMALRTGLFDSCEGHEPPSPPGLGVRGAIWVEDIDTAPSGLDVVSLRVDLVLRVSLDLAKQTSEALDRVDPRITAAALAVGEALAEDYTLGGLIREIDFHGTSEGDHLRMIAGWFEVAEKKYRAVQVRIPCLIDDVWTIGGS